MAIRDDARFLKMTTISTHSDADRSTCGAGQGEKRGGYNTMPLKEQARRGKQANGPLGKRSDRNGPRDGKLCRLGFEPELGRAEGVLSFCADTRGPIGKLGILNEVYGN
jgi:hypothetical protein